MKHLRSIAFVGLAAATLVGCKKKEESATPPAAGDKAPVATGEPMPTTGSAAEPAAPAEPAKAQPPAIGAPKGLFDCNKGERAALTGAAAKALPFSLESCPTIPSVMGTLEWGMDVETALKASKATQTEGYQGAIDGVLKVGKTRFKISFNDVGHANEIFFSTDQAGVDAMTAAWGAPLEITDLSTVSKNWFNAAKQTRVEVEVDSGDKYYVRYYGYTPIATLFAADGILSKAIIGETPEKVAELVPDIVKFESKEDSATKMAALGLDEKTVAIAKWAGADGASASLVFLGTATKSFFIPSLDFKDGKLESWGGLISTLDNPAIRDEYAAEFAAALGAPTDESSFERNDPKYVFNAPNGQKVVLYSTAGLKDWFFEIKK